MGPRQIDHGRLRYNEAVQRTFQQEMLLNLVRLKYRDNPEFLSIGGIAAQYSFEGSAGAGLTFPAGGADVLGLTGRVARSEKPTISYTPARGEDFQKGLLAPIDIETLQLLARTGWSWERLLRTTVQYMNGVNNAISAGGPTPDTRPEFEEFRRLAFLLRELQKKRWVELASAERDGPSKIVPLPRDQLDGEFVINALTGGYLFKETPNGLELFKEETYTALIVHPDALIVRPDALIVYRDALIVHPDAENVGEMPEIARLLDLYVEWNSPQPAVFEVEPAKEGWIQPTFNDVVENSAGRFRAGIVISTRSLLETMYYLSHGISVPAEHMAQGLVTITTVDQHGYPGPDWSEEMTADLFTVCSCKRHPENAAVAVQYKDYWFYIDDRDLTSQSTFTLLVELFGIEVRGGGGGGGGFLYTLNVGG